MIFICLIILFILFIFCSDIPAVIIDVKKPDHYRVEILPLEFCYGRPQLNDSVSRFGGQNLAV